MKKILGLVTASLLLASCDRTVVPDAPAPLPSMSVRLSQGAAPYSFPDAGAVGKSVSLKSITIDDTVELSSAVVASDLTVPFPAPTAESLEASLYSLDFTANDVCTGAVTVTPSDAQFASVDITQISTPEYTLSGVTNLRIQSPVDTRVNLVYADRPVTLKGSFNCGGGIVNVFDTNFRAGWNKVTETYNDGVVTVSASVGGSVVLVPAGSSLSGSGLGRSALQLR